jgi:hypothetical protein
MPHMGFPGMAPIPPPQPSFVPPPPVSFDRINILIAILGHVTYASTVCRSASTSCKCLKRNGI